MTEPVMATKKLRGLGRGLDALLGIDTSGGDSNDAASSGELRILPANQLQPGRYQPRTGMDPERLAELAESIKAQGVIQPIVVRGIGRDRYEIIAGERRWRAAQQAGLADVPAVVREVPDQAAIAMALIENIQREDLNPLEEATALSRLIREFELTHQQAAEAVGRSRAAVSNLLRLLDLPEAVRTLLEKHRLEMGHARALITLDPARATALALAAADGGWSVRELEERVRNEQSAKTNGKSDGKKKPGTDPNISRLEQDLSEKLATRVAIQHARNGRGKLVIAYHSLDELDGILERIR
ncbi:MAG: ParB/RepB/Spo0J family partition protein [Xanthomonadales bacterium]|nr:ParB/RepB/Spo0J family partition protein [Xanthomonadales bacterium]MBP7625207.1 ParB/RepB/Spo0J family partition protein [Xanthomonadales bacterium]